jgi:CDP-4-dehydro-6-deoxyglucose reductase
MAKISLIPDNIDFNTAADENILSGGLRNNLNLPHGCKSGTCGACKCKVLSGDLRLDEYNKTVLTDEERHQGYTLLCKAHAISDVVLNLPHALGGYPIRLLPSKVLSIQKINTTAILRLKTPPSQPFRFYAGQYIDIMVGGKSRSYSIANGPNDNNEVELHIRYHPGGVFSELVWNELQEGQILRFKGPLGSFQLQNTAAPIIMLCTGTGFAPIKAILEDMYNKNTQRQVYLIWGNRLLSDFYLLDQLKLWQEKLNLSITLCLTQEIATSYYAGRVTEVLTGQFSNLSQYEMYACGNLQMIEDSYNLASGLGLVKGNFFSDAFTPSV